MIKDQAILLIAATNFSQRFWKVRESVDEDKLEKEANKLAHKCLKDAEYALGQIHIAFDEIKAAEKVVEKPEGKLETKVVEHH